MSKSVFRLCVAIAAVTLLTVTVNAGTAKAAEPIKIGFVSIFSGRVAMLGEEGSKGAILAAEQINATLDSIIVIFAVSFKTDQPARNHKTPRMATFPIRKNRHFTACLALINGLSPPLPQQ